MRRSVALSEGDELVFALFPNTKTMHHLLTQAVTAAWHRHRSIRKVAESLGLPTSTLANLIEQLGVKKVGNR